MTRPPRATILEACEPAGWGARVAVSSIDRAADAGGEVALVRLAQRGDAAAFDRLAGARIDRSYRLAVAILRSEPDARDAVQEAFVAAWRQLPKLRDPASFDAWLERIVVNACRMALRHRKVVRVREIDVADPPEPRASERSAPAPDDETASVDLVRRALGRLDADKRAILVLHHVEERSVAEIAATLGIPAGTVKWRLHAARAALEKALEEESR
jgi:RNA polymerase sigma-70 factor (ECF subfamily)